MEALSTLRVMEKTRLPQTIHVVMHVQCTTGWSSHFTSLYLSPRTRTVVLSLLNYLEEKRQTRKRKDKESEKNKSNSALRGTCTWAWLADRQLDWPGMEKLAAEPGK